MSVAGPKAVGHVTEESTLCLGQKWTSSNRGTVLYMQKDGNFVTYKDGVAVWSAQTEGRGECVSFHHDGNLVIYNSDGKAIWASNTGGKVGAWLAVQNDGNVVIYTRDGHVLWASGGS